MVGSHPTLDIGRVFVGRQREVVELEAALDRALSGQGQLVMLAVEPGIGKGNLVIAEELVIAEGTARRGVANICEKIGMANRVEATSYSAQHWLSQ